MNIIIEKQDLLKALSKMTATKEAQKANTVNGLLLISALADGTINLSASDNQISVTVKSVAEVKEAGEVVTGYRRVLDIVKVLDSKMVTITTNDRHELSISGGGTNYERIPGTAREGRSFFPTDLISREKEVPTATIEKPATLIERMGILEKIIGEKVPGIYMHQVAGEKQGDPCRLRLVTANFASLLVADMQIELPEGALPQDGVMLPERAINAMGVFQGASQLTMSVHDNMVQFSDGDTRMAVGLIGPFIAYEKVLMKTAPVAGFSVSKAAFVGALKRLILAGADSKEIQNSLMTVSFNEQGMSLVARANSGVAREQVAAQHDCTDQVLYLNAQRLLVLMQSFVGDEEIHGELRGEKVPLITRNSADNMLALLQPMDPSKACMSA